MELFRSGEINGWKSLKYSYKSKNNDDTTKIRGIYFGIFNDSNSKVIFFLIIIILILYQIDYKFHLGGFSCYDALYKKKVEEIELKATAKFVKNIYPKYNYRNVFKKTKEKKSVDVFVDLDIPEKIFKEIKYLRIFEFFFFKLFFISLF